MSGVAPAVGTHVLADFHGCAVDLLRDCLRLEVLLRAAAQSAGARILVSHFHSFGRGHGVTGVVLLAESHISIHTWPETGLAAADIFMCGAASPERALTVLEESLTPRHRHIQTCLRGR